MYLFHPQYGSIPEETGHDVQSNTPSAYNVQGVFYMCRKKVMQGCCCLCFGLGMMMGYALESWFWCSVGGLGLLFLGLMLLKSR